MAALLAVVLGMGGQTFAKYITTVEGSDTATVAKWGFVANVNASGMFGANYEDGSITTETDKSKVSVSGASDVVAPGTGGSFDITLSGTASEVRAALKITLGGTPVSISGGSITPAYEPIQWTLKEGGVAVGTATNFDGLKTKIATINSENASINPGTALTSTYTIAWEWPFNDADDAISEKDTLLGRAAAAGTAATAWTDGTTNYTVDLIMDVTVEVEISQLDAVPAP